MRKKREGGKEKNKGREGEKEREEGVQLPLLSSLFPSEPNILVVEIIVVVCNLGSLI
jgi:hypothetical protein